ncbi:hypothetical protein EXT46_05390 [Pseudoalteromonas sp. CO325X]|uniref:hypothetical protein n=1 Tax=Pseudoalteromonas sp. CO325X TaxID=1777262 RepID=UPI0010232833|nr:hypothetical protein [Pseudoalteromonas sp. CO325X]RZF83728.1 hypothetical protein EXT46_05390 [Pseudoalteromonas sp. CO325X]
MAVFSVIGRNERDSSGLKIIIERLYAPDNYIEIGELAWLVYEEEKITPQGVYKKFFGDPKGEKHEPSASMFMPVDAYFGFQTSDVWEWLNKRVD